MKTLIFLLLTLANSIASACVCLNSSDDEEFESASAVLLVLVTATEFIPEGRDKHAFDTVNATFEVIDVYKGEKGNLQYLTSADTPCSGLIELVKYYVVYSSGAEVEIIDGCGPSTLVDLAEDQSYLDNLAMKKYDTGT